MSLINFYEGIKIDKVINPYYDKHGIEIPARIIFAAPSGAGKSNGALNLIYLFNKTFHEIIYCIKSADEPLVQMLEAKLQNVQIFEGGDVPPLSSFTTTDPQTKRLKRKDKKQRLIIFDDLLFDKQANRIIQDYYIRARKVGITMIYISQSFFQIPKPIRDNSQYFILGRNLLRKDLRAILQVFPTEMNLDEFGSYYNELTAEPMSFIVININKRTIRKNFTGEVFQL
jgi:hypothetical protein